MSEPGRHLLTIWCVLMAGALAIIAFAVSGGASLRTSVFELLPASDYDPVVARAVDAVDAELSGRLIYLVGHTDTAAAIKAADTLADSARALPGIAAAVSRIDADVEGAVARFYHAHRRHILSERQITAINRDDGAALAEAALATLYGPLGSGRAPLLETDPFSLLPESVAQMRGRQSAFDLDDGRVLQRAGSTTWVMVQAYLSRTPTGSNEQTALNDQLSAIQQSLTAAMPGLSVLRTGYFFYAEAGARTAKNEIALIGMGSLLGIIALITMTFRSARPLALGLLSVGGGLVLALAATFTIFGSVHVFTLVFGAGLIGIAIDYTFHYTTEDTFGRSRTPAATLSRILPAITLGGLTSIIAYSMLALSPFPGLRQVAVFSAFGLAGAYLTVVCAFRIWPAPAVQKPRPLPARLSDNWLHLTGRVPKRGRITILSVALLAGLGGLAGARFNDDVRLLQSLPATLQADEAEISRLLGTPPGTSFMLVRGYTDEAVLQREESLRRDLDALIDAGRLQGYLAVSRWVPSAHQQTRSIDAYSQLVRAQLPGYFETLGMPQADARRAYDALLAEAPPFTVAEWLASPISADRSFLWLAADAGGPASAVVVQGVQDPAALQALAAEQTYIDYIDNAAEVSRIFGNYRVTAAALLAGAYLLVMLMLTLHFGFRACLGILSAPVIAGMLALGALAALGGPLNLFNVVAVILVLGVGIDFTLFLAKTRGERSTTMLAITLSMLTTMLSFGLLATSSTHAISAFGLTVLIGIGAAWLLAPLAVPAELTRSVGDAHGEPGADNATAERA